MIAGGANNQLATAADGRRVHEAGIVYAPDYVINAGGIINVGLEYLGQGDEAEVMARIDRIPTRLDEIWDESERTGASAAEVADRIAQLIGHHEQQDQQLGRRTSRSALRPIAITVSPMHNLRSRTAGGRRSNHARG